MAGVPDDDTLTDESRRTGTRDRSTLTWTIAVIVVLLIAGVVAFGLAQGGSDEPDAVPSAPESSDTSTELVVTGGTERCMVPNAEVLSRQTLAFDGVVRSITRGQATLEPSRFYAGAATDVVVVKTPDDDLRALLAAVKFREGERYLVSATDGRVTLCGFSGPFTEERAALYDEAFGG